MFKEIYLGLLSLPIPLRFIGTPEVKWISRLLQMNELFSSLTIKPVRL
jgi:hypothetical protein